MPVTRVVSARCTSMRSAQTPDDPGRSRGGQRPQWQAATQIASAEGRLKARSRAGLPKRVRTATAGDGND